MLRELGLCAIEETFPSLNCGECHGRVTSGVLRVVWCVESFTARSIDFARRRRGGKEYGSYVDKSTLVIPNKWYRR
jgi:hypothetical protein